MQSDQIRRPVINVVFLTDQKYANLTAVAIRSLVFEFEKSASSREYALDIHVVCVDVNKEGKDGLPKAAQADLATSAISSHLVAHFLEGNPQGRQRWTLLVSLKIHLPNILPNVRRAIFLDSDMVVVDDITKLWLCDLEGHWLGVAPALNDDPICLKHFNVAPIKYKNAAEPINAGTLVMDLERMRELGVTAKLAEWQRINLKKLKLPEQEAISVNYPRQWKVLSQAWNFRSFGENYWAASSWNEYQNFLRIRPSIVHFQAGARPFDLNINLPYYEDWLRHYLHVNPGGVLKRKRISYLQFVFFEYPELFCRVSNYLPSPLIRMVLMFTLAGIVASPYAIGRYRQYLRKPEAYELRISQMLASNKSTKVSDHSSSQHVSDQRNGC